MKIALISLYDKIALGVRSLSSYLNASHHETDIIYFKTYRHIKCDEMEGGLSTKFHIQIKEDGRYALGYPEPPADEEYMVLVRLLKKQRIDLVGISLTSIHGHIAAKLSRKIKEHYSVPIIWGGIAPTLEPRFALEYADIVIRGEGEEAMLEAANCLERGDDIYNIRNICINHRDDVIQNPLRPLIKNLDELPFIDTSPKNKYAIEGNKLYENDSFLSNDRFSAKYEAMTNRGCPYQCTYCVNHQLKKLYNGSPYLRQRSAANVISELVRAKETRRIEFIEFQDDIFPWQKEWVKEFSKLYKEKVRIPFCCYLHPNHVDRFNLRALKDCGLNHAVIGVQSGSPRILYDIFHRPTPVKKMLDVARTLKKEGIFTCFDIITENPFENESDCRDTLSLLLKIPTPFSINLSRLSIFPGTEISNLAEREKSRYTQADVSRFWSSLYLLSVQRYFPRWIISIFSRSGFLKRHPQYLEFILKTYVRIKNLKR